MKFSIAFLLFGLTLVNAQAQSFKLPVPEGWNEGVIPFPIEFAPQIPYKGTEYVRTAPNWREPTSETLWSYCYLWWIDNDVEIDAKRLEQNLQGYYAGLVNRNIISRKIDSLLVFPTTAFFREVATQKGDSKTFEGSIHMLDYLSLKPMALQVQAHLIRCDQEKKLAIFFAVSPQIKTHAVWKQFNTVYEGFRCKE
jgi:hypothetical protein